MMHWYFHSIQNFAIFHTRSQRKEFVHFLFFHFLFFFITILMDYFILGNFVQGKITSFTSLYLIASFLPFISLCVRRLHDTGRSGMCLLFALIPVIGLIYLLYLLLLDSEKRVNDWGICPRRIHH